MSAVFCNLTDLGTTPVLLCGVRRRLGQGCGPKLRQVLTHRQPGYASVRWIAVCTFLPNAPGQAKAYTPRIADILREIICLLTQRVRAGRATFLIKVKSHRGEPINERADTLAEEGRTFPDDDKRWDDRTDRMTFEVQKGNTTVRSVWTNSVRNAFRRQAGWAKLQKMRATAATQWTTRVWYRHNQRWLQASKEGAEASKSGSFGTSAASLSESSCLLHESRTNIIVTTDLRSPVESAHDSASRVGERLDLASAPASRRRARFSLCKAHRRRMRSAHKPALPAGGCHLLSVRRLPTGCA